MCKKACLFFLVETYLLKTYININSKHPCASEQPSNQHSIWHFTWIIPHSYFNQAVAEQCLIFLPHKLVSWFSYSSKGEKVFPFMFTPSFLYIFYKCRHSYPFILYMPSSDPFDNHLFSYGFSNNPHWNAPASFSPLALMVNITHLHTVIPDFFLCPLSVWLSLLSEKRMRRKQQLGD